MYKGKFVSELTMSEVKEYYNELKQKCPRTGDQWADFNLLKERLIAFALQVLDGENQKERSQEPYKTELKQLKSVLSEIKDELHNPNKETCDPFVLECVDEIINKYEARIQKKITDNEEEMAIKASQQQN